MDRKYISHPPIKIEKTDKNKINKNLNLSNPNNDEVCFVISIFVVN